MRIAPLQHPSSNLQNRPPIRFAGTFENATNLTPNPYDDGTRQIEFLHASHLFREAHQLEPLITLLAQRANKAGHIAKIICHAASDGSEAYTVALLLEKHLGLEKAKAFYPINAKDLSPAIIYRNTQGYFETFELERNAFSKFMPHHRYDDYFDSKQTQVRPLLHKRVSFSQADIMQDSRKAFPQNTVLLFRNAVYWLPESSRSELAHQLSRSMPKGGLIMLGETSTDVQFKKELCKNGFKPVSGLKTAVAR